MEKTKKEIVIIGLLLLMVIALIGVSYAAFRFTGEGTKVNSITTGSITMTYEETDNTISLNGALPTTDKTGKTRLNPGEYFDFTVSSNISGDTNINYEISAKEVGDGTIDGSNIKLYLTRLTDDGEEELMTPETYNEESTSNSFTGRPSGEMSLYTSSMSSSESNRYRLRMWVDEDYNPQGDGGNLTFSVQINVYGLDRVAESLVFVAVDTFSVVKRRWSEWEYTVTVKEGTFDGNTPAFKMYYKNANDELTSITVYTKLKETSGDNEVYSLRFKAPNEEGQFPVLIHTYINGVESEEFISTNMTVK